MKNIKAVLVILGAVLAFPALHASAGDELDGPVRYSFELPPRHTQYELTAADRHWSASLVRNLRYAGEVVHFVRTDIALLRDQTPVDGKIYQALESPHLVYIVEGDVMLHFGRGQLYSPGVGGFSMHAPTSGNFIVCLNCQTGGLPFRRHSEVRRDKAVWWYGDGWNRFE